MTLALSAPVDLFGSQKAHHRALLARLAPHGQSTWQIAETHPTPTLGPGQVLVHTTHVALNPFDWQGVAFRYNVGPEAKVMGRDGSGVVVSVGDGVTRFKSGDRVWFCADSARNTTAAFQEYSVHSASHLGRTPDRLGDAEAATLGTGLITAGVTLFRALDLPLTGLSAKRPATKDPWMLIWGGSGITGVYLVQLAHQLGYKVICAASPRNHDYVRSLGADVVLNRWTEPTEMIEAIRAATDDNVSIAIDNVSKATAGLCHLVLQGSSTWRRTNGITTEDQQRSAQLVPLAGFEASPNAEDSLRAVDTLKISFSTTFYAQREFSDALLDSYGSMLEEGTLVPARVQFVEGGLAGIEKGLDELRRGTVPGGYKLVARLADTPSIRAA